MQGKGTFPGFSRRINHRDDSPLGSSGRCGESQGFHILNGNGEKLAWSSRIQVCNQMTGRKDSRNYSHYTASENGIQAWRTPPCV